MFTHYARRAAIFGCALLVSGLPVLAADVGTADAGTGSCSLAIHVTGFRNDKGALGAALFRSGDGWPEDVAKAYRHGPFPIEGDHGTAVFDHLPPGRYGVVVLHDENRNQKLDRNLLMVPKEGFGFANNPRILLTPPAFDKATTSVTCPATSIDVRLIYK